MKIVKENINNLPTWDEILKTAPLEILDLIEKSKTTLQSPEWHPEGDNYIHSRLVFDRAREYGDINLLISALFHDLGKVATTKLNKKGKWASHGHEQVSAQLVENHIDWVRDLGAWPGTVKEIVYLHMKVKQIDKMKKIKQDRLKDSPVYDKLMKFTEFDNMKTLSSEELNRYK